MHKLTDLAIGHHDALHWPSRGLGWSRYQVGCEHEDTLAARTPCAALEKTRLKLAEDQHPDSWLAWGFRFRHEGILPRSRLVASWMDLV